MNLRTQVFTTLSVLLNHLWQHMSYLATQAKLWVVISINQELLTLNQLLRIHMNQLYSRIIRSWNAMGLLETLNSLRIGRNLMMTMMKRSQMMMLFQLRKLIKRLGNINHNKVLNSKSNLWLWSMKKILKIAP